MTYLKTFLSVAGLAAALASGGATAQDVDASLAESLMAADGSVTDGIAVATGWHTCSIVRTGAGWGNHYVALTCPSGPFSNKWHIMRADQKDPMLATALAAATSNNDVQVYIAASSGSGYNEIRALYLHK